MIKGEKRKLQPNGKKSANILSLLTFWWLNSVFRTGAKRTLNKDDLLELKETDSSQEVTDRLEKNWNEELEKLKVGGKPSLAMAMIKTHASLYAKLGIVTVIEETSLIISPFLVAGLIRYFEDTETVPLSQAYLFAAAITLLPVIVSFIHFIYFYALQRVGWHLRVATCALMYKKTLRLSQKALGQATTGQIVNLGATDVTRFDSVTLFLHYIWVAPIQAGVCIYILWDTVGFSAVAGIGVIFALMLIQGFAGSIFGKLRMKTAILTDERIRLMNEVITGMRIIKMYTWEKPFADLVDIVRKKEIRKIMATAMLRAFNLSILDCSPKIIAFVTFATYVLTGGELIASQVFKVIGIYNVIQISVCLFFPSAIEKLAEARISIKRIQAFLLLDEFQSVERRVEMKLNSGGGENGQMGQTAKTQSFVEMKNFCGNWASSNRDDDKSDASLTLKNINVRVESGQLLAVIGPVGSGKSSFLNAILGELPTSSGKVEVNGKVAFSNQVPWVFSGTVRDNILFGEEYNAKWYNEVTDACALEKDFEILPQGDLTIVGERGVTLSGGQKSRVNLARAAYRKDATVCLLDDPLSAVDAAVGTHLFEHCINGIMRNKIRILVTHQLQLLQDADQIIILKEGKVAGHGTYKELQAGGTDFAELLRERKESQKVKIESSKHFLEIGQDIDVLVKDPKMPSTKGVLHANSIQSINSQYSEEAKSLLGNEEVKPSDGKFGQGAEYSALSLLDEERVEGTVGKHVYKEYFLAGAGTFLLLLFVLLNLASHVAYMSCEWWIAVWTTDYMIYNDSQPSTTLPNTTETPMQATNSTITNTPSTVAATLTSYLPPFDTGYYLKIYGVLTAITFLVVMTRSMIHFYICVSSGIQMHNKMFRAMLRTPIRFFDTNPSGRILNRFSKDIGQIDDLLPSAFCEVLFCVGLIVSILVMAMVVNYMTAIVILPMIVVFIWLRQYYVKTSRDIKRLEGTCRSPVFSLLSSTLQGIVTIRAFRAQDEFEREFHERQDLHSCAWFLFISAEQWIGVRFDLLCSFFISALAFTSLLSLSIVPVTPGQVGLTLTYAITLIGMFEWAIQQSAEVENLMTSVERVQHYYSIPPEAPAEVPEKKPPSDWPRNGAVTFDDVSFAYYEGGPTVLKEIKINIKSQEKVGIVGRTGAGKSSLISALFRLAELSEGEILIDGIPISPLGLDDLRTSLSIIPQDPILFVGTMRRNLDPFSQHTDAELWDALEQVQLKDVIGALPLKLDAELSESGSNFSVGQRQLVCLARAILRKCKILVLDEATANVDIRTDRLIQQTIREKFKLCTILTIAHRIHTVIDSDRVLVLDAGRAREFDNPHTLLQNPKSSFFKLVDNLNAEEADLLKQTAEKVYKVQNISHGLKDFGIRR